jgi:hypothetical protein
VCVGGGEEYNKNDVIQAVVPFCFAISGPWGRVTGPFSEHELAISDLVAGISRCPQGSPTIQIRP